jgi:thiamine transporter
LFLNNILGGNKMISTTKKLTVCAIMVALASVLSLVKIFTAPYGGSVTLASMAPIIIISLIYKPRWSMMSAFAYSVIQIILGFYPPPVKDILSFTLVILLDYVIAFGVLGFAGAIAKRFKNKLIGVPIATFTVIFLRFISHFLSGIVIWSSYAPKGQPVWLYSMLYNGAYLLPELIITGILLTVLVKYIDFRKLAGVR